MSGTGYDYAHGQYYQPASQNAAYTQRAHQPAPPTLPAGTSSQYSSHMTPTNNQSTPGYQDLRSYHYTAPPPAALQANTARHGPSHSISTARDDRSDTPPTLGPMAYKGYNSMTMQHRVSTPTQPGTNNRAQSSSRYGVTPQYQPHAPPTTGTLAPYGSYNSQNPQFSPQQSVSGPARSFAPAQPVENLAPATVPHQYTQSERPTSQATVDPSQVYDTYHEYQRHIKQAEADAAIRAAEEKKIEDEKYAQEQARQAAVEQALARDKRNAAEVLTSEPQTSSSAVPKAPKRPRKSNGAKPVAKAASGKRSKASTPAALDSSAEAAALTLMSAANSEGGSKKDLEAQMRDLLKQMRVLNEQDPVLLTRLWVEERDGPLHSDAIPSRPVQVAGVTPENVQSTPTQKPAPKPRAQPKKATAVTSMRPSVQQLAPEEPKTAQPSEAQAQIPRLAIPAFEKPSLVETAKSSVVANPPQRTVWPAEKLAVLAAAASDILPKLPQNTGKTISIETISAILATDPSYVQLCVQLEALGFFINRKTFAKALLTAVPDVNQVRPVASIAAPGSAAADAPPPSENAPLTSGASLREAELWLLNTSKPVIETASTPAPVVDQPSEVAVPASSNVSLPVKRKSTKDNSSSKSGAQIDPGSHPANPIDIDLQLHGLDAIKRFNDLLPSTDGGLPPIEGPSPVPQVISNNNTGKKRSRAKTTLASPGPPTPPTKQQLARKRTFGDLVDLTQLLDEEPLPFLPLTNRHEVDQTVHQLPSPPYTVQDAGTSPRTQAKGLGQIVQSGQPVMKGPRPAYFESASKLVAKPVAQAPKDSSLSLPPLPYNHPARTTQLVEPLDKYKAIRRSTYDASTIARDVLVACGRHPDMRRLNFHLEVLKLAFPEVDNTSDLSTFRWDVVDPGGPPPGSGNPQPAPYAVEDAFADDEDDDADSVLDEPRTVRQLVSGGGAGSGDGEVVTELPSRFTRPNIKTPHLKRKRRRSPGDVAVFGNPNGGSSRPTSVVSKPNSEASEAGAGTPNNDIVSGYTALHAASGEPKKKGRPVGWRKWMQKTPSGAPSGLSKRSTMASSPVPESQPEYKVYKCEWQDCRAELHNLATLRRHIHKLHLKKAPRGGYDCLWAGCGKVTSSTDKATNRTSSRFENINSATEAEWKEHVEKKHISPIAWELGDGPTGGVSGNSSLS